MLNRKVANANFIPVIFGSTWLLIVPTIFKLSPGTLTIKPPTLGSIQL
jgi:hypothetical protein